MAVELAQPQNLYHSQTKKIKNQNKKKLLAM
jgi:hypothetical protein